MTDLSKNDAHNAQPRVIGGLTFTNYPIPISGNTALICPHSGALLNTPDLSCTVANDAGVFEGITNLPAWSIRTKRDGPGF